MKQLKLSKWNLLHQSLWIVLAINMLFNMGMIKTAMAQEKLLRTLTVTGQGREKIPTTLTQVHLGVEIQGTTATEVQQKVANQTSALVNFLRSRNVIELQTTGIQLQANYDYSNNQRRLLGYIGTNTVSFRIKTEQIGNLLDEAVKAGATRIDGVSFTANEEAISSAQKEALRQATIDAQQQSEAVLKALNFTAKEVVSIQVNGANTPQPRMIQAAPMFSSVAKESTPVIGGEQTVEASVTLQISY